MTGGQVANRTAAEALLEDMPDCRILQGDKGDDTDSVRRTVGACGAMPNIPPNVNRRWTIGDERSVSATQHATFVVAFFSLPDPRSVFSKTLATL